MACLVAGTKDVGARKEAICRALAGGEESLVGRSGSLMGVGEG